MVVAITGKTADQIAEANKTMYIKDGATKDSQGLATTSTAKKFEQVLNRHYDPSRPDNQSKDRCRSARCGPGVRSSACAMPAATGLSTCRKMPRSERNFSLRPSLTPFREASVARPVSSVVCFFDWTLIRLRWIRKTTLHPASPQCPAARRAGRSPARASRRKSSPPLQRAAPED
jgi:hypothetical protein